jgi:hypothetical protein
MHAMGVREFEVLVPHLRRPRLLAELKSQCAAAGVLCTVGTEGLGKKKVAILTVGAEVNEVAFAKLSSWIYVSLGTRPHDLHGTSGSVQALVATDALQATDARTSRDLNFVVGRLARKEFLGGVGAICAATGARWEWRPQRKGLFRITLITIAGPAHVVDETAQQVLEWQRRFRPPPASS